MRTRLITLVTVVGTALLPASALARDPALIGVEQLVISAETPPSDLQRFGLTRELLEAAVKEGLGTRVGTADTTRDQLNLRLDANLVMYNFYSWGVRLEVERALAIDGQPGAYTRRVVWSNGRSGGTLLPQDARRLATVARELAEELRGELAR
ncbi:MAG TPA: hypothetical protein DCY89_07080 [Gammaproteobacteria bacterium]|nr:hypothetical protein [Gammaproteobacteria bacterium]